MTIAAVAAAGSLIGFGKSGAAGTLGPFVTVLLALTVPGRRCHRLAASDVHRGRRHDRCGLLGSLGHRGSAPAVTAAMGGILVGSLLISVVSEPVCRNIIAILMLLFAAFYTWNRRVVIPPQSLARCAWPAG